MKVKYTIFFYIFDELKKIKLIMSPLQRINRIQRFNYERGICKESVNKVLRNILKLKFK